MFLILAADQVATVARGQQRRGLWYGEALHSQLLYLMPGWVSDYVKHLVRLHLVLLG
jgi:hypothetical protein